MKTYKWEVGFEDDFIGVYSGIDEDDAIYKCKLTLKDANMWDAKRSRDSFKNRWIVNKVGA